MPAHPAGAGVDPRRRSAHRRAQRQSLHRAFAHRRRPRAGGARRLCAGWRPGARRHRIHGALAGRAAHAAAPRRDSAAGDRGADRARGHRGRSRGGRATPRRACTRATTGRARRCTCCIAATSPPQGAAPGCASAGRCPPIRSNTPRSLYETLHRLDAQHPDWIAVERPPDTPEWAGVLDRLRRAAR